MKKNILWSFLPFAVLATLMAGLVYGAVQQNYRQSANDPQIELSEDASAILTAGQPAQIFSSNAPAELTTSLAPFIIVYDQTGKPVSGTAVLNGKIPVPPQGVFDSAKKSGQNRLTWEPAKGVRFATIITPYKTAGTIVGYVLAGRSLRDVEKRENQLTVFVVAAWILALVGTYVALALRPLA